MKEEEAKTKWCPMIHGNNDSFPNKIARKRNGENWERGMCIGSDCMMWRDTGATGYYDTDRTGYCGLAGKP